MSGGRRFSNHRVRKEISRILKRTDPGDVVTTERLCEIINGRHKNRDYSRQRLGTLLREREDLKRIGNGLWQVVN